MALVLAGATAAIGFRLSTLGAGQPPSRLQPGDARHPSRAAPAGAPAVEAGLLPWRLAAPLSREVVLSTTGAALTVVGGLTTNNVSSSGVYTLNPTTGSLATTGSLTAPLHDAAAAQLGGRDVVFGGGASTTVGTVEALPAAAGASGSANSQSATVVGTLPQPRSDAGAVAIAGTAYVVGGYDGTNADASVVATTDGHTFRSVATLALPVRYPAVGALDGKIYVFGGQAVTGPDAGRPTDAIEMVDPGRHTASVVGHLPEPLSGASAVTVGGAIYLAGGESTAPPPFVPGVGTTQLTPTGAGQGSSTTSPNITDGYTVGPRQRARARLVGTTVASTLTAVNTVYAFSPATHRVLLAGHLQVPVSHAAAAVVGSRVWLVGGESSGQPLDVAQMFVPDTAFGTAGSPGAGSPYFGMKLLVADRGNNRLLLLDPSMNVSWHYPDPSLPQDPLGFYFPDDAFFVNHGTAIISNQEQNETIVEIGYPSGKIVWSYGHPKVQGSSAGYLHEPDDAYVLRNGDITVADAENCRVVVIHPNGTVAGQIGTTGVCVHNPPTSMGSPNGDTPLADGNLLVSEINGSWVSEYTLTGELVWTRHLPISYPSDPQQLGADQYLIADYANPGQVLEFTREGAITYRYAVSAGPGRLDHPSLSELLPSGVIMVNDDYRNRMVAIDPATGALVWQYGITDTAGTATGMLNTPDGFDLLAPDGSTPTHRATG
jgi:hypothetical protein